MNPTIYIRSMTAADLPFAVQRIAEVGWLIEDRANLDGYFIHDPQGCLLAEVEGKPVGICTATSYGKSGFIGKLIVSPEARGQGVGAALLNYGVDILRRWCRLARCRFHTTAFRQSLAEPMMTGYDGRIVVRNRLPVLQ